MRRVFCWLTALCVMVLHFTSIVSLAQESVMEAAERHVPKTRTRTTPPLVTLPGPLPLFLRIAAIGETAPPDEVLLLLARNVARIGYSYRNKDRSPTEYLLLLRGYLKQASELKALAGPDGRILISDCSEAVPLLSILGYGFRQPCGPNALLGAEDPKRAFLTMDSGFPLLQLEESFRESKTFTYDFSSTQLPVLSDPGDWSANGKDVVSSLVDDPELSLLYSALGRLDEGTRVTLRQSIGMQKLLPRAAILDFYGSHIQIRSGRILVPGGAPAEPVWKALVGVGPDSPAAFVTRLLQKDGGWLAAFFDILARTARSQQGYFTDARRLPLFYAAWRGRTTDPSPASSAYRPAPGLLLLASRLDFDADGQPRIPGSLEIWKEILRRNRDTRIGREWARRADALKRPEQLIEAMVGLSRSPVREVAFQLFRVLIEIDRCRSPQQRLSPGTVRLLEANLSRFSSLYPIFTEWSDLDEESIAQLFVLAKGLDAIPNHAVRADAIGIFQAVLGLWQIMARQGQISGAHINQSWRDAIRPFTGIKSSGKLFEATRASLAALTRAATGRSSLSQKEIVMVLAGPDQQDSKESQQVRAQLANRIRVVMESQRLASLDTLFELADGLKQAAAGEAVPRDALVSRARELKEFDVPRPIFSSAERSMWAAGQSYNWHSTLQSRTDLAKIFTATSISAKAAADAIGLLTPFLRDALVGLNYAYYEPPGAQVLHNDPMLVRSHDFSEPILPSRGAWLESYLFGRGVTAGGGTHLAGSLADIPYRISQIEQDFLVPDSIPALIWEDLVPTVLTGAVLPRWWRVTPDELHAVTLYQRFGEDLLKASARDAAIRQMTLDILSDRLYPQRLEEVENLLDADNVEEVLSHVAPSEIFFLAAEFRKRHPRAETGGTAGKELEILAQQRPDEVSRERISRDFGVPHPAMAYTFRRELFELKLFPTFMAYSSRLMAESWESNNLYWARLADEMGYPPVMLHTLVPALTRRLVENIAGTHLEDWPAVLRALRETGEEFRSGKIGTGFEVEALPRYSISGGRNF